jgi:hypothetical protein
MGPHAGRPQSSSQHIARFVSLGVSNCKLSVIYVYLTVLVHLVVLAAELSHQIGVNRAEKEMAARILAGKVEDFERELKRQSDNFQQMQEALEKSLQSTCFFFWFQFYCSLMRFCVERQVRVMVG